VKGRANCFARSNSDRSPLYDVRNHANRILGEDRGMRSDVSRTIRLRVSNSGWLAEPKLAATSPPSPVGLRRDSLPRYASEGWWSQTGSNRRPHACKARALPAELWPRNQKTNAQHSIEVVGLGRLELPTSRLSSARSNQLSYKPLTRGACCDARPPASTPEAIAQALTPGACSSAKKEKRRRRNPANGTQTVWRPSGP
jgi:hypothetical protein